MDEVIVAKLKAREEGIRLAPLEPENCEVCGQLMPEGCIGWCSYCPGNEVTSRAEAYADFYAWGGWRRAFGEYTDEEWERVKHRTTCGRPTLTSAK